MLTCEGHEFKANLEDTVRHKTWKKKRQEVWGEKKGMRKERKEEKRNKEETGGRKEKKGEEAKREKRVGTVWGCSSLGTVLV